MPEQEETGAPVVVYVAPSPIAAEVIKAKLESYGIRAALRYESAGRVLGLTVDGWGETRVLVPAAQAQEARAILAEAAGPSPAEAEGKPASGREPAVFSALAGAGRVGVHGVLIATGDGLVVSLAGGERPHVGAVAVATPYHSPRHPAEARASTSVLALTAHRDDVVARPLAELAARRTGQVAVVAVGLHVDSATPEEIAALTDNARQALEDLLAQLEARRE